jgi:hypothetical protein
MLPKFLGSIVCTVFMSIVYFIIGITFLTPSSGSYIDAAAELSVLFAIAGAGAGILTGLMISCLTGGRKPVLVGAITSLAAWVFIITCFWIGTGGGSFDPQRVLTVLAMWTATGAFGGLGYKLIPQNK